MSTYVNSVLIKYSVAPQHAAADGVRSGAGCILAPLDITSRTKILLCISNHCPLLYVLRNSFSVVLGRVQRRQRSQRSKQRREIQATAQIPCHVSAMLHRLPLALKSFLCRPAAPVISRCRREFSLGRAKADFTVSRRCAAPAPSNLVSHQG